MELASMSQEQLHRLLMTAKAESTRDWLMLLTSFHHGLRASETVNLKVSAIRDNWLTVSRLKGSKQTTQELVADDADPLLDERAGLTAWIADNNLRPSNFLWRMTPRHFGRLMHGYAATAGLPFSLGHPHTLKHTAAVYRLRVLKQPIDFVKQALGHESLSSTGRYLVTNDQDASDSYIAARKGVEGGVLVGS